MTAYYNEIDPFAAQWLRELIKAGHIADGIVDERSIEDVTKSDLNGFTQCHFFAGIGVWSYALRKAGWSDDRPVWTGSCPCQPFSTAGKGAGFADERHLWPAFHWLIDQCRPDIVFGEQVAGKDGLAWLDLVCTDLENSRYTCGAAVTAACGFGAPHQRKRLYWVAKSDCQRRKELNALLWEKQINHSETAGSREVGGVADSDSEWRHDRRRLHRGRHETRHGGEAPERMYPWRKIERGCLAGGMAYAHGGNASAEGIQRSGEQRQQSQDGGSLHCERPRPTNGFWRDADWLGCRDGKWRPVESGTFPLANGASARVGRLRGYGNAICAQQAEAFIEAVMASLFPN